MCFLFIFSFLIQQRWVFAENKEPNAQEVSYENEITKD
jgi:putative flippase GtrA